MVEDDNTSGRGSSQRRCSEQEQRQSLCQCSMYLSERGSPYEVGMEMGMEMEEINLAAGQSHQTWQCCQELRNFDQQCRYEVIREVVRRQHQGQGQGQEGQWQGEKMQQMLQKAQSLPQRCNFQQPQQFQILAVWF